MSSLGPRARQYIQERINLHLEGIDATPLHNGVYDADDGSPETLYQLATAAEAAYHAADCERDRDRTDPVRLRADRAYEAAREGLNEYIDELVAKECLHVIENADEWAEDDEWDHYDPETYEAAKHEAREWLQMHTDVAKRVGVLDELEVRA